MKKVFFSRAMDGIGFDEIASTSLEVQQIIDATGLELCNPFRGDRKVFSENENRLPQDVVNRDIGELKQADVFLCDMTITNRNYIGTLCEMMYAHFMKIPIVIYTGDTGYERRYWIRYHAKYVCKNLEEAMEFIKNHLW